MDLTEQLFARPITAFANRLVDVGARVHTYRLAWRPDNSPLGATHSVELPLVLGRQAWQGAAFLGTTPWHRIDRLGRAMRRTWAYFARTGDIRASTELPLTWLRIDVRNR